MYLGTFRARPRIPIAGSWVPWPCRQLRLRVSEVVERRTSESVALDSLWEVVAVACSCCSAGRASRSGCSRGRPRAPCREDPHVVLGRGAEYWAVAPPSPSARRWSTMTALPRTTATPLTAFPAWGTRRRRVEVVLRAASSADSPPSARARRSSRQSSALRRLRDRLRRRSSPRSCSHRVLVVGCLKSNLAILDSPRNCGPLVEPRARSPAPVLGRDSGLGMKVA